MKKTTLIALSLLFLAACSYARTRGELPQKNAKVFVASDDPKAAVIGNKDLGKWGYWNIVPDKKDADYIVDYSVKKAWLISFFHPHFKGRARIVNAQTGEAVYSTRRANSTMRAISFNHRKTVIKKLDRIMAQQAG